jgi:hypothetical protein
MGREKEKSIFYQGMIRSLRPLEDQIELKPLKDLLELMETALRNTFPEANIKVGSGITSWKGSGWIGLNVNNMDYFFVVYLQEADILVFETFNIEIDPVKLADQPGRIFESYGKKRWENTLDCGAADLDFFGKSAHEQLTMLEQFLEECKLILDAA